MLFLEAELDANFDLNKAFDLNGRSFTQQRKCFSQADAKLYEGSNAS